MSKYPHTVDIYQRDKTSDGMGGEAFAWDTVRSSSVKCRFYKVGHVGEDLEKRDTGETELYDYKVMMDEVAYKGERLLKGSIYYEVINVYEVAGTSSAHHWQLKVKEI